MPVVSLINMKGGVGKTSLTLALSDFLSASYRKRILLIDLDPQANLTTACIEEQRWAFLDGKKRTIADVFDAVVRDATIAPHFEAVSRVRGAVPVQLLASTPRLAEVESEAMESDQAWRRRVGSPYLVLHQALYHLLDPYDYVIIDCPPSLGPITLNGLALTDGYLIPVMPSPVATSGLELLQRKIVQFAQGLRRPIKRYGTVVNRVDARANLHAAIIRELEGNPEAKPVWSTRIARSVRVEEGWDNPEARTLVQRWGASHDDFFALAEEFIRRVN